MDIAVLSDIHSNYVALKRCLRHALSRGAAAFLFLGDYAGELAFPDKTMRILYDLAGKYRCFFVRGNKEDYWLDHRTGGEKGWECGNSASGSLWYAYRALTKADLDFFARMLPSRVLTPGGPPALTACHGSPFSTREKLLPGDAHTLEIMERSETPVILCGHTHIQRKIEHGGACVLNPGSVGMPLHSGGKAQYLILHGSGGRWTEEFFSLDYDTERVIAELHDSGLCEYAPYWSLTTEHLLREGTVSHGTVLKRAMALCREAAGACEWPDIPERYWAQAYGELIGADRP